SGGELQGVDGGAVNLESGGAVVTSVRSSGPLNVFNSNALVVRGTGIENAGTITVNPTAGPSGTFVQFEVDGTLSGDGTLALNANPSNLDTALLRSFGGGT